MIWRHTFFDFLEDDPCRFHNLTIVMNILKIIGTLWEFLGKLCKLLETLSEHFRNSLELFGTLRNPK